MRKLGIYFVISTLIVSLCPVNPITAYAEESDPDELKEDRLSTEEELLDLRSTDEAIVKFKEEKIVLFAEKAKEEIDFFDDIPLQNEEPTLSIPDETEAILLISEDVDQEELKEEDEEEEFAFIEYTYIDEEDEENKEEITIEGYVHIDHIVLVNEAEAFKEERNAKKDAEEENEKVDEVEKDTNTEDEGTDNSVNDKDTDSNKEQVIDDEVTVDENEQGKSDSNEKNSTSDKTQDESNVEKEKVTTNKEQNSIKPFASSVLKKGDRDSKVIQLKKDLAKLGFKVPGNGTNYFGVETEKKVKEFQKYYGLSQTGTVNSATRTKINNQINSPFQLGKRHNDTLQLKRELNKTEFGGISVTTLYGDFTVTRVKQFQKHFGLKVTGIADEVTRAKIKSVVNKSFQKGDRHNDIIQIKKNLNKIGFGGISVTTYYGDFTVQRVKEFQKYYGLKVTGIADEVTQKKISSVANSPFQVGKRHNDTLQLKRDLNKIGFGGISVTTLYGDFTAQRVREFQKYYGLKATGIADEKTLAKINSVANSPLQVGKRHNDTLQLKRDLNKIGFGGISVTTLYGDFTAQRVREFQKYYGLKVTGIADEKTLAKINSVANSPFQIGKRHNDTLQLKRDLNKIGFGGISITTLYGDFTAQRVKEFQKYYGLKVTGIADEITQKKISSVANSPFQVGKRHNDTLQLKRDLNKIGFGGISVTTLYGDFTAQRVKEFQKHYGLVVNGIADEVTLAKIADVVKNGGNTSPPSKPTTKTEYTDYKLTLNQALDIQMSQEIIITDKYKDAPAYVSANYLRLTGSAKVSGSMVNIRTSPNTTSTVAFQLAGGTPITITGTATGTSVSGSTVWYKIARDGKTYYIHSSLASGAQAEVTGNVNVRAGKGSSYHSFGLLKKGEKVNLISQGPSWHEISYATWRKPTRNDMKAYLDPSNNDKFQHLRLDSSVGVSASELNKVLSSKGILIGQGQAFINGAKKHGVNEAYLISHAFLETGHGSSTLANGVEVGKDKNGKLVRVTSSNRNSLTAIKTTYNMFGIGAIDANPVNGGAITAYENGWFTPAAAIEGGAKWIGDGYIYNAHKQNTLYKMKWNPRMGEGYAWKQYATDIAWATKQVSQIKNIYNQLDNPSYHYDIPKYK